MHVQPLVLVLGLTWVQTFIRDGEACTSVSLVQLPVVDSALTSLSIALLDEAISISSS